MAEPRRKLNIPIYGATIAPEGAVHENVIDAEVIEPSATPGERLRDGAARGARAAAGFANNVRDNGLRDTFVTQPADRVREAAGRQDSRAADREAGRQRRAGHRQAQSASARSRKAAGQQRRNLEDQAATDPLAALKLSTVRAGESYMDSLRRSGILGADQTPAKQRETLTGLHGIYTQMMVLQCVRPLQNGLSGANVVQALGLAASMWMLSPNFRTQMKDYVGQVGDAIKGRIDAKGAFKDDKAMSKLERLERKGRGDQLSGKWRKRLDKMERAERGHRDPFTAESAAMTEVALAEAAYADMRAPGADRDQVLNRYESSLSVLYSYAEADGLGREEISRSMRVLVGQRLKREPELASVFGELGHGRFTKSAPREVIIEESGERATVWTGDYVDSYEGRVISSGSFRMRPPMNLDEHRVLSAETLAAEMTSVANAEEMDDVFSQYVVAGSVGRYPDVIDAVDDPAMRRRLGKARTMFASMAADGLSLADQRFAYSKAFIDAIEIAQEARPDLGREWVARYGSDWRERVAEDINWYNDMGAAAERERRGSGEACEFTHQQADAPSTQPNEDIVDAEEVPARRRRGQAANWSPRAPRKRLEDTVHEGELLAGHAPGIEMVDGEVAEVRSVGSAPARSALTAGAKGVAARSAAAQATDRRGAVGRVRNAKVNQHYNEVETGGITGFGSDDAQPLQDVDYELG